MGASPLDFSMQQTNSYLEAFCYLEAAEISLKERQQEQG